MNGLTNATSQGVAWCPKHQTAKWCCWFDGHCLTRPGSQKTWVFISLHRLQIRHSQILLILVRPLPIGYFTFYYFSFFLIFNRMDAWSLMRGDAFIHFVCGSRRVNIRLGVLLLISKSPQMYVFCANGFWYFINNKKMRRRKEVTYIVFAYLSEIVITFITILAIAAIFITKSILPRLLVGRLGFVLDGVSINGRFEAERS